MNDRHLKAFLTVVDCGSFSKAAKALYMTPQSLMQQINMLELELGCKFLDRSHRGVTVTPTGQHFYQGAKKLVHDQKALIAECQELSAGERPSIRIGRVMGLFPSLIPALISSHRKRFPDVHFRFIDSTFDRIPEDIEQGKFDVAEYPYLADLNGRHIRYCGVTTKPYVCLMSAGNPLAGANPLTVQKLAGQKIYALHIGEMAHLNAALEQCDPPTKLMTAPGDLFSVTELCNEGAVYLVPQTIAHMYKPLAAVRLDFEINVELGLICAAPEDPLVRSFLDTARETPV